MLGMKSTSNWTVAKPTEATTTNTAPSPASFFTLTEHNCGKERDVEKKKSELWSIYHPNYSFNMDLHCFNTHPNASFHPTEMAETQWNEGSVASLHTDD